MAHRRRTTTPEQNLADAIEQGILVDEEDSWLLELWPWYIHSQGYVVHAVQFSNRRGSVYLHHCIMGMPWYEDEVVDHINRNPLDNRRENLRFVIHRRNTLNSWRGDDDMHNIKVRAYTTPISYQLSMTRAGSTRYATFHSLEEAKAERTKWENEDGTP